MHRLIVVVDRDNGFAKKGTLPWNVPEDTAFFREKTRGETIIMGRKTFLSLPVRPLPEKRNVVLSRTCSDFPGAEVFSSFEEASARHENAWIIGGLTVCSYALAHRQVNIVYLTRLRQSYGADLFLEENIWSGFSWFLLHATKSAKFLLGLRLSSSRRRETDTSFIKK
jgi:dihydrofolate reductase